MSKGKRGERERETKRERNKKTDSFLAIENKLMVTRGQVGRGMGETDDGD